MVSSYKALSIWAKRFSSPKKERKLLTNGNKSFLSFVDAQRLVKCLRSASGISLRLPCPSRDKTRFKEQGAADVTIP